MITDEQLSELEAKAKAAGRHWGFYHPPPNVDTVLELVAELRRLIHNNKILSECLYQMQIAAIDLAKRAE